MVRKVHYVLQVWAQSLKRERQRQRRSLPLTGQSRWPQRNNKPSPTLSCVPCNQKKAKRKNVDMQYYLPLPPAHKHWPFWISFCLPQHQRVNEVEQRMFPQDMAWKWQGITLCSQLPGWYGDWGASTNAFGSHEGILNIRGWPGWVSRAQGQVQQPQMPVSMRESRPRGTDPEPSKEAKILSFVYFFYIFKWKNSFWNAAMLLEVTKYDLYFYLVEGKMFTPWKALNVRHRKPQ